MREKVMRVLRKRHREKCNSLLPVWLCVTPNERPQRRDPHQNISVGRIHEVSHHWGCSSVPLSSSVWNYSGTSEVPCSLMKL